MSKDIPTIMIPSDGPPRPNRPNYRPSLIRLGIVAAVGLLIIYAAYFWLIRRAVVGPDQIMVLVKKCGSRNLPGDQIIIPRPPDAAKDPAGYAEWDKQYGDCNGILEQVYLPGTYFTFSPFDYERMILPLGSADIPGNKVGVVVRNFGAKLDSGEASLTGQVMADPRAASAVRCRERYRRASIMNMPIRTPTRSSWSIQCRLIPATAASSR